MDDVIKTLEYQELRHPTDVTNFMRNNGLSLQNVCIVRSDHRQGGFIVFYEREERCSHI